MTTTRAANLAPCTCSTVPPARGCSSLWRVMGPRTDLFGFSVAVSSDGARVVVGAYYDDDQGSNSGSVHVFDGTTGARLLKLVASDGAEGDRFGLSVAVSSDGARVVVGAYYDEGSVHEFDGNTGERLLKLASDGYSYDTFGRSVAVSSDGARVVVGASEDDDQGTRSGSVYVFDGTTGERLLKLVASDGLRRGPRGGGGLRGRQRRRQRIWLRVRVRRHHRHHQDGHEFRDVKHYY
ncbi:unnamed protein product [Prorocentrum cordatum]|uniref:Uncharacterized protein n=1 Tax=Prorocentrum cordatum TaxID=2364126 RepID=A0ABN9VER9_9DINO|nr:unnamed protein product [Polarella glacialis]